MDKEIILNKLESLRRCIARVEEKTPSSLLVLVDDLDRQDIIVLNLERAIQVCVDVGLHIIAESDARVPDSMAETFRALGRMDILDNELAVRLTKAVGFRNTAVHAYQAIDWEIVFSIITTRLVDFRQFVAQIMKHAQQM